MFPADTLLAQHWSGQLPVCPATLAKNLGIAVRGSKVLAWVCQTTATVGTPTILVNRGEPPLRQRFAIAHALGHLVLGHLEPNESHTDTAASYSSSAARIADRQANAFALALLAPERPLRYGIGTGRLSSVEALSTTFGLSQAAIRQRLQDLGILT